MRAVTLQQPMAHAVLHLGKNVENRSQWTPWRRISGETVAVHGGAAWSRVYADEVQGVCGQRLEADMVVAGALLGVVDVTGMHWEQGGCCAPWGRRNSLHVLLANARPLPQPIPCRGQLGIWHVPAAAVAALEAL